MSQKKVDAYKKEKANRSQIIKKEKRILMLEKIIGLVVCLLVVVWIGFSVYSKTTANTETVTKETVLDTTALDGYAAGIDADETEAEEENEGEDTEESEEELSEETEE